MRGGLAHDGGHLDLGGKSLGGQCQVILLGEVHFGESPVEHKPVSDQPGEGDLCGDAVLESADVGERRSRFGVRSRTGGGNERERHPVHLGVLGWQHPVLVRGVAATTQTSPHHLLAQKLGGERPHSENVGDGVGVPALGQHRH